MNKIGWGELVVILLIALLVLGPDKLPELARTLGKALGAVKKYVRDTANELDEVDELRDIQRDMQDIRDDLDAVGRAVERSVQEAEKPPAASPRTVPETPAQKEPTPPETPARTIENESVQEDAEHGR